MPDGRDSSSFGNPDASTHPADADRQANMPRRSQNVDPGGAYQTSQAEIPDLPCNLRMSSDDQRPSRWILFAVAGTSDQLQVECHRPGGVRILIVNAEVIPATKVMPKSIPLPDAKPDRGRPAVLKVCCTTTWRLTFF